MNRFKKGAFRMAVGAQVPIIPMVSKPLKTVLDVPNKIAKGGQHEIKILPMISTTGMTESDIPDLVARCEEIYRDQLSGYLGCDKADVFKTDDET